MDVEVALGNSNAMWAEYARGRYRRVSVRVQRIREWSDIARGVGVERDWRLRSF
jgi:hypothetical protein